MTQRRAFSVAVFARHRGRVLLIQHRRLRAWLPPGGEVEAGETPLEAARRELREETGLEGRFDLALGVDGTPPGFLGFEEHAAGSKGLHMNFAFVADVDTDHVTPNDEFTDYRWVSADDVAALDPPANVLQLARAALTARSAPPDATIAKATNSPIDVARRWLAAFNAHDLEGILCLYSEDAVHVSPKLRARRPETNGEVRGKAALRAWFADALERLPNLNYRERRLTADDARVFMEYDRVNHGEPTYAVAEVLEVRDGYIYASAVYHG